MKPDRLSKSIFVLVFVFITCFVAAQQQTPPSIPTTGFAGLDQYRANRIAVFTDDYGQLARYRDANATLGPPAAGENRVVFFGDSITDIWNLDQYFPGKPYVNRGIGGQTTPQMLVRFRQDVIDLHPKVVVILAGTNDIAGNTGQIAMKTSQRTSLRLPIWRARMEFTLSIRRCFPYTTTPTSPKIFLRNGQWTRILALNVWLKDYCAKNNIVYLDYFPALVDDKGLLKKELADDGLHPNAAGFKIMAPMAEAAIEKGLK